ncbi:helix-turn-helix domain-containing protein [Pseudomonas sp.]|uniref:helix-turn-helix domain-containing protein n=1 Tax=Pseudomonas sp. TaxID=306 RepID=UPI00260C42AF|nr:helix-turn-helix domain-containing protein [Pseudomonas sp.]
MKEMDIGEVARRSGLPASTLRYYEEKGLIRSIGRRGLSRVFAASVLEQLALIALGQAAMFSLDDIATMLDANGQPDIDHQRLAHKADELDRTIQHLCTLRDALRRAAACPAPRHAECARFQAMLSAIGPGGLKRKTPDLPARRFSAPLISPAQSRP